MGHSPRNYAKKIVARYTSLSRLAFPKDSSKPVIYINGTVTEGLANTIGRDSEIGLTLDEAIKMHALLGRNIDDVAFHLGASVKDRRAALLSRAEYNNLTMVHHD